MTKNLRVAYALALLAIVWTLTIAPARAQSVYGSIFGTVTDKTGAVIPGATVTVTDVAKGTVVNIVSNEAGDYTASHLVPDTYDVKVDSKGFKSYINKGVIVQADTAPRVDVALEPAGAGSETIEVNADSTPQLKTDRADVSTVFNQQQVSDLPVGDQNFTNLQLLLPGAQLLGWSHAADENPQGSRQIQVDGQAFGGTAFELDGTDNQDPILGIIVINPALDAVTETKISTQNFDAELGKAVASVVTAQTRSGTNSFHGSAYDFRTSNANLAREPFSQTKGTTSDIPGGLKNRFGGSIGGRIIRDRVFFFGNYEGQRQKVGTSAKSTLPSKLLTETCLGNQHTTSESVTSGCDFSEYLAALPNGTGAIYDNSAAGKGAQFKDNVIPTDRLSAQFINLLKILEPYTKQEQGGSLNGLDGNFSKSGTGLFNSNAWTVRGDGTISSKANGFVRFSRFTSVLTGSVAFGDAGGPGFGLGNFGGSSTGANDSLAIGTDYVFSPKLVTDLRLGYYRYNVIDSKFDVGKDFATQLGIPGINFGDKFTSGAPGFFLSTLNGGSQQPVYGAGLNVQRCNCPLTEREDQFQIVNNWTKTWGNHAFKLGADLRYARNLRVPSDNDRAGVLNFGNGPTSNAGAAGLSFATFALGDVTSFNRYVSVSTNAKEFQKRTFFYAQDTWRVTNKLTANLGVRWELYFPESVNANGNGALMDLKDGYIHVAGIGGVPRNMGWSIDKQKQFEPRIGFAYQLDPKTVIRTGYGRSFDIGVFGSIFGHVVTQNLPVLANQSINSGNNPTGQAFCLGSPTDNPGCNPANNSTETQPSGGGPIKFAFPTVPSNGLLPNPGDQVNTKARANPLRFPTLDAWNLSVQRALTPTLALTVAYVGNKGTHTLSAGDGNNTNPNESALFMPGSFQIDGNTLSSVNGQALHWDPYPKNADANGIGADGGTSNTNYLRRYFGGSLPACGGQQCGWTQDVTYYGDDQNTNYNALQITLAQQNWHGLSVTGNYAWQSSFNEGGGYSTWNKKVTYGRDDNVRQSSSTIYGSYQLPFGKGKQFLTGASRLADAIVGGYQLSGTVTMASGLPFSLGSTCQHDELDNTGTLVKANDLSGNAPCRPNVIPGGHMKTSLTSFDPNTKQRKFYTAQSLNGGLFSDAGLNTIGNAGRNTYWGPSFFNTDLSMSKKIQLYESVEAQFRVDAYNAVNHINPGNPGGNILSDGTIGGEAPGPGPRQLEFSFRLQF